MTTVTRTSAKSKTAAKKPAFFTLVGGARPVAGAKLYAHTLAALLTLRMVSTKDKADSAHLVAIIGPRAVSHHLEESNFKRVRNMVSLTAQGQLFFASRLKASDNTPPRCTEAMVDRYVAVLTTGASDASLGITKQHLKPYYAE